MLPLPGFLSLLGMACTGAGSGDSGGAAVDGTLPTPHHPSAEYSAEEAASMIKEAVRFGLPMPPPLLSVWSTLMGQGDGTCPGPPGSDWLAVFVPEGCTAASGTWYQGVGGGGNGWADEDNDGFGDSWVSGLKADGTIRDASGVTFTFGGDVSFDFTGTPPDGGTFDGRMLGTYHYPASETAWLSEGTSTGTYFSGTIGPGLTEYTLLMDGGFTTGENAIAMSDFELFGACAGFPSGTIGVRDTSGYWYDLTYDESTCDACGDVTFDGRENLGRACADPSAAFDIVMKDVLAQMLASG